MWNSSRVADAAHEESMSTFGTDEGVLSATVLFVDRDPDARFVYQSMATAEGFRVELAADVHQAIVLAHLMLLDAAVVGVRSNGPDALDLVRRLRDNPRTRGIPIVVLASEDDPRLSAAIREPGFDAHLLKPYAEWHLYRLLGILVRSRERRSRSRAGVRRAS
jgi:CheY-like chemotaxis protein